MEILARLHLTQSKTFFWPLLVLVQLILACLTILLPYYAVPLFLLAIAMLAMFFYPEFAYYLYVLFISCHLVILQIVNAHSLPARLQYIAGVPIDTVGLPVFAAELLVIVAVILWIFSRMANTRPAYPKTPLDLSMVAFFMWVAFSLFWSVDLNMGFLKLFVLFCCYLGFFLSVAIIRTKKILNTVIWIFIFMGVVNSAVAAYSLRGNPVLKDIYSSGNISLVFSFIHMARQRGMGLSYSQSTAYFLNISIILAIGMFFITKDIKKRLILVLSILFMVYGHLTTSSKAGILGLLSGIIFLVISYKPLRRYWVIALIAIVVILKILSVLVYFSWPWPDRIELMVGRKSLFPREIIWGTGFENLIKSYGFGYGSSSFYPAHSIFFSILFETGIIGFFIWIWLLIRLFNTVRYSLNKFLSPYYQMMIFIFSAGMISILTFGMFDILYYEEGMWTFMGIGMAIVNMANRFSRGCLENE